MTPFEWLNVGAWLLVVAGLTIVFDHLHVLTRKVGDLMSAKEDFDAARARLVNAANAVLGHVQTIKETHVSADVLAAGTADMHSVAEAMENLVKPESPPAS